MYELQSLREANNEANDDAVNDAEQALKKIFDDMRRWIRENGDPEVVRERLVLDRSSSVCNGPSSFSISFWAVRRVRERSFSVSIRVLRNRTR